MWSRPDPSDHVDGVDSLEEMHRKQTEFEQDMMSNLSEHFGNVPGSVTDGMSKTMAKAAGEEDPGQHTTEKESVYDGGVSPRLLALAAGVVGFAIVFGGDL